MILENLLNKYKKLLQKYESSSNQSHIIWMIDEIFKMLENVQEDKIEKLFKINRWLGFIQGYLYSHLLRTVDELRNETRGIDSELFEILGRR